MWATVGKVSTLLALGTLSGVPRGVVGQRDGGGGGRGGAGSGDDDASTVYCEEDGSSAHYDEVLSGSGSTMMRWGASDTGCPNHVNWGLNPNDAQQQSINMSIPAYPMMFASGGTTDLSSTANAVGIMRNGVAMFSAWTNEQVSEYENTAFYLEADSFDLCGGHSTGVGTYHYHNTAGCLQEQAAVAAGTSASEHSALLGWAYDGFPIYGQLGPDGVEMKICGLNGADSTACLDVCSGYEALLPDVDDFTYRYYTSCGFDESFFPFTTNCFRGCCPDGVTCSRKVEACGDSPESGYTADYVPTLATPLDEQYDTDLIEGDDTDFIDTRNSVDCTLYMGGSSVTTTTTSSSGPDPTPAPTPAPVPTPRPITILTPGPITILTSSSEDPPSPSPVTTPPPITILTPAPITQLTSSANAPRATPAPSAAAVTIPSPTEPASPVSSETQPPVPEGDSETSSEYDDDSGYVEVGTMTTVDVAATAYHEDPGLDFGDNGCGTVGCMPALAHDGDSSDLESRWSCTESIVPNGGICQITFAFGEPMDLKDVQVSFFKGEERTRWLKIHINDHEIGTFESYTGSTFNSFDIEETGVESVTMESVGIASADWIALLEVRFMVEP